jgi:hypothetical protein
LESNGTLCVKERSTPEYAELEADREKWRKRAEAARVGDEKWYCDVPALQSQL